MEADKLAASPRSRPRPGPNSAPSAGVKATASRPGDAGRERRSIGRLAGLFALWKAILLAVACASPGPGYDTSTQLLLERYAPPAQSLFGRAVEHVVIRLTRWDGIYFSSNAERGYVFEQEWAFGGAFVRAPTVVARAISFLPLSSIVANALGAIILSHAFHLVAVLALYGLAHELIPSSPARRERIAFTAACLHIISPAGLFLSAPYAESGFATWTFLGIYFYVRGVKQRLSGRSPLAWPLPTGFFFSLAAATRGNGLLNGLVLLWEAISILFLAPWNRRHALPLLLRVIVSGSLVAVGFALPQSVAYIEYCTRTASDASPPRDWCSRVPPSIFQWVQEHYWDNGLFRYWTLNNLPLFLIAAPMLAVLVLTALTCITNPDAVASACRAREQRRERAGDMIRSEGPAKDVERAVLVHCLPRLAAPQVLIAFLTALTFHVQIINRLSSGYPVWYLVLAVAIHSPPGTRRGGAARDWGTIGRALLGGKRLQWIVRAMAMYAVVQGGLYAAFLPPA